MTPSFSDHVTLKKLEVHVVKNCGLHQISTRVDSEAPIQLRIIIGKSTVK